MAIEKLYALAEQKDPNLPYIFVSSDDGANWSNNTFATSDNFFPPRDYRVKPDNQNMVLFANDYKYNETATLGLSYSTDACASVTQCGGNFSGPAYSDIIWNWIHICPADPNIVWAISYGKGSRSTSGTIIARSLDGGLSFYQINNGQSIDGFISTEWGCIFSPNGTTVVIAIDSDVYLSTDGGSSFNYLASLPSIGEFGSTFPNVYTNDTGTVIYAATMLGVYQYDYAGSSFNIIASSPSALPNPYFVPLEYINPTTFYWTQGEYGSGYHMLETSDNFGSINSRLYYINTDVPTFLRPSFYNYSTGYYIDYDQDRKYLVVTKTSDGAVSGTPKNHLISTSYDPGKVWSARSIRVATEVITGCGCPEGTVYNEETGLCDTTTSVCPEGSTWNPVTQQCETPAEPCLLDLTIVIDQSSSISAAEQAGLKSLLYNIIDGIEDSGGANRITSDNVRVGLVTFGVTGANLLNLAGGAGAWTSLPAGGTIKAAISGLPATPAGATASFDGLRSGYLNLTGTNSRNGVADKRILFITDGWPNYTNGVSYNGINPGTAVGDGSCPISPNSANDPLRCADAAWTANKRQNYYATMQLADDIKNANGPDMIDPANITLVVLGAQPDRTQTIGAFVGGLNVTVTDANVFPNVPFPSGTTASLTNTTYFSVCQWDLATNGNPSVPAGNTNTYCKYWDAWYPEDGTGGYRFPSDNALGNPDYFDATFASASSIATSIVNSVICFKPAHQLPCDEPCVFNDQTGECICSADTFNPCCYDLQDCKTGLPLYTVNTYALGYDPLAPYIGQVITIEGTDQCLFLQVTTNCTNTTPFPLDSALNIIPYENGCQECEQAQGSNPCYKLLNCANENVLYTKLNLASYVGKTVTLNEYPEMCWQVLQTDVCPGPFIYLTLGPDTYKDCECCAQYHCK